MDQKRPVYRLLRKGEITRDLLNEDIYILWPDDGSWYQATVIKVLLQPWLLAAHKPSTSRACTQLHAWHAALQASKWTR